MTSDRASCTQVAGSISNCKQYHGTACMLCVYPYQLVDDACIYLEPADQLCIQYQKITANNLLICLKCVAGYTPTPNGCVPCPVNCSECFYLSQVGVNLTSTYIYQKHFTFSAINFTTEFSLATLICSTCAYTYNSTYPYNCY